MRGACSAYGRGVSVYRVLVVKPEGKRPLGKPRRRWVIILRLIFRNWDREALPGLLSLRIGNAGANAVMNLRVPQNTMNFLTR